MTESPRPLSNVDSLNITETTGQNIYSSKSFTGVDIIAYIFYPGLYTPEMLALATKSTKPEDSGIYRRLGSLRYFSWGTTRTKSLVGQLGLGKGKGFTRGTRVVSGIMVFLQLDRTAFTPLYNNQTRTDNLDSLYNHIKNPDELPPFDLLLVYSNESGNQSYRTIQTVEIVQSQGTDSVDDPNPVESYSFVALDITPLTPYTDRDIKRLTPLTDSKTYGNVISYPSGVPYLNPPIVSKGPSEEVSSPFGLNEIFNLQPIKSPKDYFSSATSLLNSIGSTPSSSSGSTVTPPVIIAVPPIGDSIT